MIIAITCIIAIVVIVFVLGVRPKDLREPEPVSPFAHLDERKAAIYENLLAKYQEQIDQDTKNLD